MTKFLLIIFLIMFCYKQVAERVILDKVPACENFASIEEGEIDPDEQKKSKTEGDDMLYFLAHDTLLFKSSLLQVSIANYAKPLSGYPILLFTPPDSI